MQKSQDRIRNIKNQLQELAEEIEDWYPNVEEKGSDEEQKAKDTIRLLGELCTFCTLEIVPDL